MTLVRPDYIERNAQGHMIALYCKVCGVEIGVNRGGNFHRLSNYAELKMQFLGGSKHVTVICSDCVSAVAASRELMWEVHNADIDDMAKELPALMLQKFRLAPKFVVADISRQGLP